MGGFGAEEDGGQGPVLAFVEVELPPAHPVWLALLAAGSGLVLPAATALVVAALLAAPTVPHTSGAALGADTLLTLLEALLAGLGVGMLVEAAWRHSRLPGLGPASFFPLRWARHRWAHLRASRLLRRLGQVPARPEATPLIIGLARQVARMNVYRRTHPQRDARLAAGMAKAVGLGPAECGIARLSALLKDIGMLGIPPGILERAGPLTTGERETIYRHREAAAEMLAPYVGLQVAHVVRWRQGAFDAAAYELFGDTEGPSVARVVEVVDAYDALVTDRAYRGGRCKEDSFAELQAASGTQLDPVAVEALIRLESRRRLRLWAPMPAVAALLRRTEHLVHVSVEPGAAVVTTVVLGGAAWLGLSWAAAIQIGLRH